MNRRKLLSVALAIALPCALLIPLRATRSWQARVVALPPTLGGTSDLQWRTNGLALASPYFGFDALRAPLQIQSWNGSVPLRAFKAERIVPDASGQNAATSDIVGSHEEVTMWNAERARPNAGTANLRRVGGKRQPGYSWQLGSPVALSPDGRRVAGAVYGPGEIIIADARNGARVASFGIPNENGRYSQSAQAAAFSPDGRELAIVGAQTVWFVDGATGKLARSWLHSKKQVKRVNRIVWSPDGHKIALSQGDTPQLFSDGNSVKTPRTRVILSVYDARTGAILRTRSQTASDQQYVGITNLAFSGDSAQLAWGTYDAGAQVMDLASGDTKSYPQSAPIVMSQTVYPHHPDGANYVAYSPDGRTLAIVSDRQIALRRVR